MNDKHFLGYATLEEWVKQIDPYRPVCAIQTFHTHGDRGLVHRACYVTCAQMDAERTVHYWRIQGPSLAYVVGVSGLEILDSDRPKLAACDVLWQLVQEFLGSLNIEVREAMFSAPKDMFWLHGTADCLVYDREAQTYRRVG